VVIKRCVTARVKWCSWSEDYRSSVVGQVWTAVS